ncbi:energy transducer TonB [Thalassotalea piscium]
MTNLASLVAIIVLGIFCTYEAQADEDINCSNYNNTWSDTLILPEEISNIILPNYPIRHAEKGLVGGCVIANFNIDKTGNARDVVIISADTKRIFDREVKRAIRKSNFIELAETQGAKLAFEFALYEKNVENNKAFFVYPLKSVIHESKAYDKAYALERSEPKYPLVAARSGQSGWTLLSTIINNKGIPEDIVVIYSSGVRAFDIEAKKALAKWIYTPSNRKDKTSEASHILVKLAFNPHTRNNEISEKFSLRYEEAQTSIKNNNLSTTKQLLEALDTGAYLSFQERLMMSEINARYFRKTNDFPSEIESLIDLYETVKTYYKEPSDFRTSVILSMYKAFFNNNEYKRMTDVYNFTQTLTDKEQFNSRLQKHVLSIKAIHEADNPIVRKAKVTGKNSFSHLLTKKSFSIELQKGKIDNIDIRCDFGRQETKFESEKVYKIEDDLGDCMLLVAAEKQTEFILRER